MLQGLFIAAAVCYQLPNAKSGAGAQQYEVWLGGGTDDHEVIIGRVGGKIPPSFIMVPPTVGTWGERGTPSGSGGSRSSLFPTTRLPSPFPRKGHFPCCTWLREVKGA